jgi:hypothetical protein
MWVYTVDSRERWRDGEMERDGERWWSVLRRDERWKKRDGTVEWSGPTDQ